LKQDSKNPTSDEELLERSALGDRQAFEHLYDRYWSKLVWFARGFLKDEEKAQDIIQDVFIKIIERPALFESGKRFSTWVYTVTANQCKNQIRNESNRSRIVGQIENEIRPGEPEINIDRKALRRRLDEAVITLNETEKRIYFLRFEQEAQVKEIASILGMPEGTVKSAIFYLLKKIAVQLKDYQDESR
jgi:RNA polymerase sigma-70 factor (ECF subfamily)